MKEAVRFHVFVELSPCLLTCFSQSTLKLCHFLVQRHPTRLWIKFKSPAVPFKAAAEAAYLQNYPPIPPEIGPALHFFNFTPNFVAFVGPTVLRIPKWWSDLCTSELDYCHTVCLLNWELLSQETVHVLFWSTSRLPLLISDVAGLNTYLPDLFFSLSCSGGK